MLQPRSRLVFKYHCEPASHEDADALCDQIRLASEYRRELALIENRSRALRRSISRNLPTTVKQELTAIQRDPDRKLARNQILDSLSRPTTSDADRDTQIRDAVRAIAALGVSMVSATRMIDARLLSDAEHAACLALRGDFARRGLSWGTYQDADEAHDASCRTTAILDDVRVPLSGSIGCAAVHLQPARALHEDDSWIRIGELVRRGSEIDKSGRVRPARHRDVRIRIGTLPDRQPRFARLCVLIHREIPAGWEVSWAKVHRRQIGSKYRWEFHVTASMPEGAPARPDPAGGRPRFAACGVDIGWRLVDGGVRIARWWGSDGRSGEAIVSDRIMGADRKSDDLRAIRDRVKNEEKAALLGFRSSDIALAADWFREATPSMHQWLRTSRFVGLARSWSTRRFPGDETAFNRLQAWLRQDRHLWDWEAFNRAKRQRRVDAIIRGLAVQLGRDYERIGIEAPFTAKLVKKAARCEACRDRARRCDACARDERLRRLAATRVPHATPAKTRREIQIFGTSNGAIVIEIDPANTTKTCAGCGYVRSEVDDWSPLVIACSRCDLAEDQDVTAAKNLARLASAVVLGPDGRPLATPDGGNCEGRSGKLGVRRMRKSTNSKPI